jgi:hypothetical protein
MSSMNRVSTLLAGGTAALLCCALFLLSSCGTGAQQQLAKEVLFTLDIGKMEDEVNIRYEKGVPFTDKTRIFMRNGIFYIGNGSSNKVMKFTSYGDILASYYNPGQNPDPFLLGREREEGKVSNRNAYPYRFNKIGELAVTSRGELLVEDKVSEAQQEWNSEYQAMQNRVVLRFDKDGNYMDYLGQEGIGGTPFTFIKNIQVTKRDEIIVISRAMRHWFVFWYGPSGALMYRMVISVENLPVPEDTNLMPSLSTVSADIDERLVYLKIDYYGRSAEGSEGGRGSVNYQRSLMWWFDLQREEFTGHVEIPVKYDERRLSEFEEKERVKRIYEYLGNTRGNVFYFLTPYGEDKFELLLLRRNGSVVARRNLEISEEGVHYRDFFLTSKGVLTALVAYEYTVDIVWWRSDRLMEVRDEDSNAGTYGGD